MRSRFAVLLAITAVCVTTAWAGWSPEEQITNNRKANDLRFVRQNHIVVATNGVRHLVWNGDGGAAFYKRYYPGTGWTSDFRLGSSSSSHPSIALDPNGTDIHVVWQASAGGDQHIFYQKCVPGSSGNGGWVGSPLDLLPRKKYGMWPAIACFQDLGGTGHIAVAWFRLWAEVGFRECVGGVWGNTIYFTKPAIAGDVSIAVDPQARYGDIFLTYYTLDPETLFVLRRQGGVWQGLEPVTTEYSFNNPIEVDPVTGYPHVVCSDGVFPGENGRVRHTYWEPSSGWQPLELVSDPNVSANSSGKMCFAGGSGFVVWSESSSASDRGIRFRIGGYGNWSAPGWVTSVYTAGLPDLAASSTGSVYVAWKDYRDGQLRGRLYTPGNFSGLDAEPVVHTQGLLLDASPNPCLRGTVVRYCLPAAANVALRLYDASGALARTVDCGRAEPSLHSVSLSVQGLTRGVYVLKLEAGASTLTRKLVIN